MRVTDVDVSQNNASMSCSKYPQYCNNGKPKPAKELTRMRNKPEKEKDNGKLTSTNPVKNYCGNSSGLACLANVTQDISTGIDLVGVGLIETPAVAVGCVEGGPLGCAVAEVGVIAIWNTTLNNAEFGASSASLVFTVLDDFNNNGGWGEN